ncbi:peptidoglycan-binding protein [Microvirga pudoricolor]|uniref:peptidoglycan-binding protein n=1 Tax=Microvirga pudoricolor TaxID=2778729 RepID=UPI00194E187C|nr:peptidoglycan-binding protein [Microvirga pudoricolor]MBM6596773.1 hypothetical protein [Microvirga pudoricolor]
MNWLKQCLCVLMLLGVSASARAASITVLPGDRTSLVRVEGRLDFGDERVFREKVAGWTGGLVVFDSLGGNLLAGLGIGRAIRDAGLNTLVMNDETCASACALAWLGGKTRYAGPRSHIAFHAAWMLKDGEKVETGSGNALVGAYLYSLGLRDNAIVYITQAGPDEAKSLSFRDAEVLGIQVSEFSVPLPPSTTAMRAEPPGLPSGPAPLQLRVPAPTRDPQTNPQGQPDAAPAQPRPMELASLDVAGQVQRRLHERGYFQGLVDGVWGPRSRIALRRFKGNNGLGFDDAWDVKTQAALFDDRSQAAWAGYQPPFNEDTAAGLFRPFAPSPGASLHPLNPNDAAAIQSYLNRLSYYRKQGDGVWGIASRSALTDFKVANGLEPNDLWDATVEDALRRPALVPATLTPFGDWAQDPGTCADPNRVGRISVTARSIEAGGALCRLDPPLQRAADGWRTTALCSRGAASETAQVHLQLINGRLIDRSLVGRGAAPRPAVFDRCP